MERLSQLFLEHIARVNSLTLPNASKLLDQCWKDVAAKFNMRYNQVYKSFYTYGILSRCLAKSCSEADLKECEKMCHCIVYEGECKPIYLENAPLINADPDKYAKSLKLPELESLVKYASYLYYNYGKGGLTDNSFDALEYDLNKRLKYRGRRYEKIGAPPLEKIKTRLPYPMPRLEKLYPDSLKLLDFLNQMPNSQLICSDKLDGVSGLVVYEYGEFHLYTRGDGVEGGDVSYLRDFISLPDLSGLTSLVVRGEFVIPREVWKDKYQGTYVNARAFATGKINQGYVSESLRDVHFVAYQIVAWDEPEIPPPSQAFKMLEALGFETSVYQEISHPLIFDLMTLYKQHREESIYDIDGLVMSYDVPRGEMVAFKMLLEEQLRNTTVHSIEWNISRHGRYVPVCIFNSVYINGARIHRASAFNAKHVVDWHLGHGTHIVVKRSGDVIPQIENVLVNEEIDPILPSDEYDWHWQRSDIVLDEIESNPEVQKKRILYFFQTLGTKGIGEGRVRTMYESGLDTIKKITNATEADFLKLKRVGKVLAKKLYTNIHTSMKTAKLDRFLIALTTFKSKIGRALIKKLTRSYPDIFSDDTATILRKLKEQKIPGIGDKRRKDIAESIPIFMNELYSLNKADIKDALKHQKTRIAELKKKGFNSKIEGGAFVMTGFMGHPYLDLEDYLYENMADIVSSVTSSTRAVISAVVTNITPKMTHAQSLGVPVYSVEEFLKEFNVPLKVKPLPESAVLGED